MTIDTNEQKIEELLSRGVSEVIDKEHLRARLLSGAQLRIKLGIDPTSPNLHLGRAVVLLKLRAFQELGHKIILLVGNATGVIGDTSDKEAERPMLTHEDIAANMKDYTQQAGKILNMEHVEVVHNADWLDKLGYKEIGEHADAFSLHEFIARDNIKKRLDTGKRVSLREVLYPLMQGYDSVHLEADVELGGTDQRFNLLAGRTLQERCDQEPQDVMMVNLILGTDARKMSSSWGNTINIMDSAEQMGEKLMNLPDNQVETYLTHCTVEPLERIVEICSMEDARMQKVALANAVITLYHGSDIAAAESERLSKKFITKEGIAETVEALHTKCGTTMLDMLVASGGASSKSDARRKIEQGGVSLDGEKVSDVHAVATAAMHGRILKVGKKFFRRVMSDE